jgi:hypothetical protein
MFINMVFTILSFFFHSLPFSVFNSSSGLKEIGVFQSSSIDSEKVKKIRDSIDAGISLKSAKFLSY